MTDLFDIFRKLKDHEASPPPEDVMTRIFEALDDANNTEEEAHIRERYEKLKELEVSPPPYAFLFIKNKIDHSHKLTSLQDFEIAPPSSALTEIIDKVKPHNDRKKRNKNTVIKAVYIARSAAAIVLAMIAGWVVYQATGSPKNAETAIGSLSLSSAKDTGGALSNHASTHSQTAATKNVLYGNQEGGAATQDITVSYSIEIQSTKKEGGIAKTYNGGIKTLFVGGDSVRIKLVRPVCEQSIYIFPGNKNKQTVAVMDESGKNKFKFFLTTGEWNRYNSEYNGITCTQTSDTVSILNCLCQKMIILLKDGRTVEAYYTDSIKANAQAQVEPLFTCVPGLVLKYTCTSKKEKVVYTATSVDRRKIEPGIFHVPSNGITTRKFNGGNGFDRDR